MSIICKGITLSGQRCMRKRKADSDFCFQHCRSAKYIQDKPSDCIICCESLANQKHPLACGHWIHTNCIVMSAKAKCPICRTKLTLGKRDSERIEKLAKKRTAENLAEEEEELRRGLQDQVAALIAPTLRDSIEQVVTTLLIDSIDVDSINVLTDIFDENTFSDLLSNLMGYELLESDDDEYED